MKLFTTMRAKVKQLEADHARLLHRGFFGLVVGAVFNYLLSRPDALLCCKTIAYVLLALGFVQVLIAGSTWVGTKLYRVLRKKPSRL